MILKLFGLALFGLSLGCVFQFQGTESFAGFDWSTLMLAAFGPVGLVLMCSDGAVASRTLNAIFGPSPYARGQRQERDALFLHKVRKAYYDEGPKAFETVKLTGLSEPVQKMIDRLAGRMPSAEVLELIESERDRMYDRLQQCLKALSLGVRMATPVGMLGTILVMVQLIGALPDTSHIGSDMSRAVLTTFYGLLFSLVLWTPLQQRVERILDVQNDGYGRLLQWLTYLEKGEAGRGSGEGSDHSTTQEIPRHHIQHTGTR